LVSAETARPAPSGRSASGSEILSQCVLRVGSQADLSLKKTGGFAPRRNIRGRGLIRSAFDSEVDDEHPEIDFKELFERSIYAQKMKEG
jgi:hypothetical protein